MSHSETITPTNILILGAGIGGYETYRELARQLKHSGLKKEITIVDENNFFTFTPMLHEVATGAVEPAHCAIPLRSLIRQPHRFLKARVLGINPAAKTVETSAGVLSYEFCVVALGSSVNFFNVPGAAEYSYHVRTLSAAMILQRDFVSALENTPPNISVTVVGGGWTGVEVAGQYSHFIKTDIKKMYPGKNISVTLVQNAKGLLPQLPEKVQQRVRERLEKEGVTIIVDTATTAVTPNSVVLSNGKKLDSDFTIWTAGFENIAPQYVPLSLCEQARIPVNGQLHHNTHDSLYAVGDIMLGIDPHSKKPYPQLGEAADREGKFVASDIIARIKNQRRSTFSFKSFGTFLPLGNWYGVAVIGSLVFFGPLAWWLRRTAYVLVIPGFWRKLKIIIDWTLHSFTHRYILDLRD